MIRRCCEEVTSSSARGRNPAARRHPHLCLGSYRVTAPSESDRAHLQGVPHPHLSIMTEPGYSRLSRSCCPSSLDGPSQPRAWSEVERAESLDKNPEAAYVF